MHWNWQQPDWPHFNWNKDFLAKAEKQFLVGAGVLIGTATHLTDDARNQFAIDEMVIEAVTH